MLWWFVPRGGVSTLSCNGDPHKIAPVVTAEMRDKDSVAIGYRYWYWYRLLFPWFLDLAGQSDVGAML